MGCCTQEPLPVFLSQSRGVCRDCDDRGERLVEVRYVAEGDRVYLERWCPTHGVSRALVAESLSWYLDALQAPVAARPPAKTVPRTGRCPSSCGPCTFHGQRCHLPVLSITNACELRCPICFTYNRADRRYFMSREDFRRHVDHVVAQTGGVDLVNVTGGEPTLHPELPALLDEARRPEIGRVTMNTNGLRLARDEELVRALADRGVYVILSLNTFDPATSVRLHGRDIVEDKRRALAQLERFGVPTTVLMVLAGGVNEGELPAMLSLLEGERFVRSLTIQTMTYTGQGGKSFAPRQHLPVDGVERRIEEATAGHIRQADFQPLPTAHPLCYGACYLAQDGSGTLRPLRRLLDRETLARHLGDGYLLHPSGALETDLKAAVDRLWSEDGPPELLAAVKRMLRRLYPSGEPLSVFERQRRAEEMVKTIYVHAHMDEDTWEVGRARRCPDQVPVLEDGAGGEAPPRLVGACNYNLFHRRNDERFWVKP